VTFLFVYEISPESLNGFAPNSHGRHDGRALGLVCIEKYQYIPSIMEHITGGISSPNNVSMNSGKKLLLKWQ